MSDGLPRACCVQGAGRVDVVDVNMVVQVAKKGGELIRCIYSPLE